MRAGEPGEKVFGGWVVIVCLARFLRRRGCWDCKKRARRRIMEDRKMKKTYLLEGLDCANCAAEVERNVGKLDGVNSASVNFLTLKMVLDVNEEGFDETYKKIVKTVKKTEPDVEIKEL